MNLPMIAFVMGGIGVLGGIALFLLDDRKTSPTSAKVVTTPNAPTVYVIEMGDGSRCAVLSSLNHGAMAIHCDWRPR